MIDVNLILLGEKLPTELQINHPQVKVRVKGPYSFLSYGPDEITIEINIVTTDLAVLFVIDTSYNTTLGAIQKYIREIKDKGKFVFCTINKDNIDKIELESIIKEVGPENYLNKPSADELTLRLEMFIDNWIKKESKTLNATSQSDSRLGASSNTNFASPYKQARRTDLTEDFWNQQIEYIKEKKIIPVIGAQFSHSHRKIAGEWSETYKYPFEEEREYLSTVSYWTKLVKGDRPNYMIANATHGSENEQRSLEAINLLSELPFPGYITTAYDNLLFSALAKREGIIPYRLLCDWDPFTKNVAGKIEKLKDLVKTFNKDKSYGERFYFDRHSFELEYSNIKEASSNKTSHPFVFYLHGNSVIKQSMIITEVDYIRALLNPQGKFDLGTILITDNQDSDSDSQNLYVSPFRFLFIGHQSTDWGFRVLFRGLYPDLVSEDIFKVHKGSVYIEQFTCDDSYKNDLEKYFREMNIEAVVMDPLEYLTELVDRYKKSEASKE